uniref:ABTB2/3 histone-like domain-containing protein n=1 Tax=Strigamia maritima TaxID=126957 RepID=T1IRS1_STRMM
MTSNSTALLEFRDADQYRQPVPGEGHEIVKPKPRRPEVLSTSGTRSLKPRSESAKLQEKPPVPVKNNFQTPRNPIVVKVEMHPEPDVTEKLRTSDRNTHKSSLPIDWGSLSKSSSDGDGGVSRCKHTTNRKSRRRNVINLPHHHLSMDQLHVIPIRQEMYAGSSSDENRSSGHASMSDSHTSSSPLAEAMMQGRLRADADHGHAIVVHHEPHWSCQSSLKSVPEDDRIVVNPMPLPPKQSHRRLQLHRNRNRREEVGFQEATGLAEIRQAMEAMTLRSCSGSESESGVRRLMRHSSLETVNTNVTSADEFVWIDSHSRLVEVQHLPWSNHEILRVLQNGRLDEAVERISMDVIPRLSYLLQRGLVRIAIEIQRFSRQLGLTSKQEVHSAFKVILAPALAHSCIQACFRAAAMLGGEAQFRLCKSSRAGLHFSIGRFHRWMCDVRLGKFIHEYAAIYLTAGLENLLEEIMIQCMPSNGSTMTAIGLEHSIANNGELWGLLQPYSHLNTGRTASGELAMPRWPSSLSDSDAVYFSYGNDKAAEQSLLTTCVGSIWELKICEQYNPASKTKNKTDCYVVNVCA